MQATETITCRDFVDHSTDLLEGVVSAELARELGTHAEGCGDCRRYLGQVEMTVDLSFGLTSHGSLLQTDREDLEVIHERFHKASSRQSASRPPERGQDDSCMGLDEATARGFLADSLEDHEQIAVLQHLISGCAPCVQTCRSVAMPGLEGKLRVRESRREPRPSRSTEFRYRETLESALREKGWRPDVSQCTRALLLWLIREGRSRLSSDPASCERIASLASTVSECLTPTDRARAAMFWGHVVRKTTANFREVDQHFDRAEALLAQHDRSSLLVAKLLRMRALARYCQSRFEEALVLLDEASEIYRDKGDFARIGECALERAAVELELFGPQKAVATLLGAVPLIDWNDSPRYGLAATQNLTVYYADSGSVRRACLALEVCRKQLPLLGPCRVESLSLDWAEGKARNAGGDFEGAARLLSSIRERFLELGLQSQAAFVSLDLAISLLGQRKYGELLPLAEAMVAYFMSRRIAGEALASLKLFQEAVVARSITVFQVRCLERHLARDPTL